MHRCHHMVPGTVLLIEFTVASGAYAKPKVYVGSIVGIAVQTPCIAFTFGNQTLPCRIERLGSVPCRNAHALAGEIEIVLITANDDIGLVAGAVIEINALAELSGNERPAAGTGRCASTRRDRRGVRHWPAGPSGL